jgi:hypothetical protein
MFDILHDTFLRLGDAYRFGPPHLRQIVRKMAVQIATEKSRGNTTVTVPVHPEFAKPAGGSSGRDHWPRSLHRKDGEGPRAGDEQEGLGGKVQEVRGARRHQRAERAAMACARPAPRSQLPPIVPRAR